MRKITKTRLAEYIEPTACWVWKKSLSKKGYGTFNFDKKRPPAHRAMYELFWGEVPKELVIDHLCRNTKCVNPLHLEAVTNAENIRRGSAATKTHCKRGHELRGLNLVPRKDGHRECRTCVRLRRKIKSI